MIVDLIELESQEELEVLYDLIEPAVEGKIDEDEDDSEVERQVTQIILRREGENLASYGTRVDRFLNLIAFLENSSYIDEEINRLKNLKTSRANLAKRLKAMVLYRLQIDGTKRLDTPKHRLSVVTKGGQQPVEVDYDVSEDIALIPPEYVITAISHKLDKKAIAQDLKNGKELSWARLLEREEYLRIK